MRELHRGERGNSVQLMQRLLIRKLRQTPGHFVFNYDGNFDDPTEKALKAFQKSVHMRPAGVCDAATWRALGLTIEQRHDITLLGQPTDMSCWSAAASMILGNMSASAPGHLIDPEGALRGDIDSVREFARQWGWHVPGHGLSTDELVQLLDERPLWVGATGNDFGHAVVFGEIIGDGSAFATGVTVFDPLPVGQGSRYVTFLDHLVLQSGTSEEEVSLDYVIVPSWPR